MSPTDFNPPFDQLQCSKIKDYLCLRSLDPEKYLWHLVAYLESMMRIFTLPPEPKSTNSDLSICVVVYDIIVLLREPSKPRFIQKHRVNSFRDGMLTVST